MKIESNLVPYNINDILLTCHNLNQIHTHFNNEIKKLHDEDKLFLLDIFEGTHVSEVIKGIGKKKTRNKTAKI